MKCGLENSNRELLIKWRTAIEKAGYAVGEMKFRRVPELWWCMIKDDISIEEVQSIIKNVQP